MRKYLSILPLSIFMLGCAEQVPETPGNLAAKQAAYLDFTKSQCGAMLGGPGVGELTRASNDLKKRAAALGADPGAYSASESRIAVAWSFSVGMMDRTSACNDFVTSSYNIISAG